MNPFRPTASTRSGCPRRGIAARCFIPCLLLLLLLPAAAAGAHKAPAISIVAPDGMVGNSVAAVSIVDAIRLLRGAFPGSAVRLNDTAADVQLVLTLDNTASPSPPGRIFSNRKYPVLAYPEHWYEWRSTVRNGRIILVLSSPSCEGISFGLYGLLQEKLGLRFIHPKQTIIPHYGRWPLPPSFRWKAAPRFAKKGFHLHTLHPVELTEQLHNPDYPRAFQEVKEYIDWLVRNGQNLFQFFLLRNVDRARWPAYARRIVDYAHSRGILVGVEISLSMLQQNAFQAVKLVTCRPYKRQVDESLAWLMLAPWDFVTVDFTMGEYQPDLGRHLSGLRDHLLKEIRDGYGKKAVLTTHVIPGDSRSAAAPADAAAGILVHTVMCYSIDEPRAPVYGNANQRHMLARAIEESRVRETWYWPESAYWVAFDNAVPLLLLPYLDARWSDMQTMEKVGVDGHLTFSSGWEWGYWLVDWSIARWSWKYEENSRPALDDPALRLRELFPGKESGRHWEHALALQKYYLKDRGLMPFLAAADPSAELFGFFSRPFAPRLPFALPWLLREATDAEAQKVMDGPIAALREYAARMHHLVKRLRSLSSGSDGIAQELIDSLEVTALRAEHRSLTLQALIMARKGDTAAGTRDSFLQRAASLRLRALAIVQRRERHYRYAVDVIARQRDSATSYDFGYLFPASDLHFWKREEEQVRRRRFDAFFMNLWNFREVTGISSLW